MLYVGCDFCETLPRKIFRFLLCVFVSDFFFTLRFLGYALRLLAFLRAYNSWEVSSSADEDWNWGRQGNFFFLYCMFYSFILPAHERKRALCAAAEREVRDVIGLSG